MWWRRFFVYLYLNVCLENCKHPLQLLIYALFLRLATLLQTFSSSFHFWWWYTSPHSLALPPGLKRSCGRFGFITLDDSTQICFWQRGYFLFSLGNSWAQQFRSQCASFSKCDVMTIGDAIKRRSQRRERSCSCCWFNRSWSVLFQSKRTTDRSGHSPCMTSTTTAKSPER